MCDIFGAQGASSVQRVPQWIVSLTRHPYTETKESQDKKILTLYNPCLQL
jgi:hypothetical protein